MFHSQSVQIFLCLFFCYYFNVCLQYHRLHIKRIYDDDDDDEGDMIVTLTVQALSCICTCQVLKGRSLVLYLFTEVT